MGVLLVSGLAFAYTPHYGQHSGEQNGISYSLVYDNPPLYLDFPDDGYYRLPAFYLGSTMRYTITLMNTAKRTFEHLRVIGVQEYLEGGIVEGQDWTEETMPTILSNGLSQTFYVDELRPGQTVVLEGSFFVPFEAHPGLDRTRLLVLHWQPANANSANGGTGRVIVNDGFAGVYCPPAALN
ncbi:TPA: hypothetical protein HA244_06070 [Candidatus Micrarchaeota archaeon]|nr:hypothetical protein [Candidatus Micrarchaeota archaeon]